MSSPEDTEQFRRADGRFGQQHRAEGPAMILPGGGPVPGTPSATLPVAPFGCQVCGREERSHAIEWAEGVGYHSWKAPTQEQRRMRLLARFAPQEPEPEATDTDDVNEQVYRCCACRDDAEFPSDTAARADGWVKARGVWTCDQCVSGHSAEQQDLYNHQWDRI